MEFRQIQYFVCLFEEGTVTRAARRLHIVQPALSAQIAKLEAELDRKLFVRTPSGMQPTAEATRMYRLFLPVLGDFSRAREQMLQVEGELTGNVRVGMIATIAQGVLANVVTDYAEEHPRVALSLTDGYSGALIDEVSDGRLDAAIINRPYRRLGLNTDVVADEDLLLVSANDARTDAGRTPSAVDFRSVVDGRLVIPSRRHGLRAILDGIAQTENVVLEPAVEIDSIASIVSFVRHSTFRTILPRIAVHRELVAGEVQAHMIENPRLLREVVCISDPRRPPSAATTAFLKVLQNHVRLAMRRTCTKGTCGKQMPD